MPAIFFKALLSLGEKILQIRYFIKSHCTFFSQSIIFSEYVNFSSHSLCIFHPDWNETHAPRHASHRRIMKNSYLLLSLSRWLQSNWIYCDTGGKHRLLRSPPPVWRKLNIPAFVAFQCKYLKHRRCFCLMDVINESKEARKACFGNLTGKEWWCLPHTELRSVYWCVNTKRFRRQTTQSLLENVSGMALTCPPCWLSTYVQLNIGINNAVM